MEYTIPNLVVGVVDALAEPENIQTPFNILMLGENWIDVIGDLEYLAGFKISWNSEPENQNKAWIVTDKKYGSKIYEITFPLPDKYNYEL